MICDTCEWIQAERMRPRRYKRSKKPWHFDDYDESEYTLDSDTSHVQNRAVSFGKPLQNRKLDLYPKNAGIQIKITGQIQISIVGENGARRELFRLVCACFLLNSLYLYVVCESSLYTTLKRYWLTK